jgi:hypothetical protein
MIRLFLISIIVFILNIPFGYWRTNVKIFSLQWFMAIHIPVIIVIALRIFSGLGFAWYTYVSIVTCFALGQQLGLVVHRKICRTFQDVSSCLVMDLKRIIFS